MKALLVDVDSKIANLALMKLSAFHGARGDQVLLDRRRLPNGRIRRIGSIESSGFGPDRVYVSCLFTWNRPAAESIAASWRGRAEVLCGGTGFDHGKPASERAYLPPEAEVAPPDYGLYPPHAYRKERFDYALGFCLRGCNRSCQFCDVPRKEGRIDVRNFRPPETWVGEFRKALLLDNDPALYPDFYQRLIFEWFIANKVKCSITQGYDVRCVTPERAALLAELKPWDSNFRDRTLYIAWDYIGIEGAVRKGIETLLGAGIKPRYITCYMIVGFPPAATSGARCHVDGADLTGPHAADLHRFDVLWNEYRVLPFVMRFDNRHDDPWLNAFSRWVNKRVFKSGTGSWAEYRYNPERDDGGSP